MDSLMQRFMDVFNQTADTWERSLRQARRSGVMVIVDVGSTEDRATRVKWDPNLFVRLGPFSRMAWRRDFVEKVLALDSVPNLEEFPSV